MPLTEHTLLTWVELNMAMCWVAMPNQVHSLRRDNTRVLASLYKLWDAFQAFLQPTPATWDAFLAYLQLAPAMWDTFPQPILQTTRRRQVCPVWSFRNTEAFKY